jgi:gluconate 5-dehydrogenase
MTKGSTMTEIESLFSLAGRVALVTGASRGLGWAFAEALAGAGAHVVLNARHAEALEEGATKLSDRGLAASVASFDVRDEAATATAVESLLADHGRLDVLINNAGVIKRADLADYDSGTWQHVIDVNLTACFRLAREAARPMAAAGWGRIVNIASVMGLIGRPSIPAYVASKHGLIGMTRSLAAELGPRGVTVNAICPGYFATEMAQPLMQDEEFNEMVCSRTPIGRWGDPGELAGAVIFLASGAGSYVNGAALAVDGGMTAVL